MSHDRELPDNLQPPGDADLVELFDAQHASVPEALDKHILAAAQQAVSEPDSSNTRQSGPGMKGWFAIAATLLMGVTLTPLLLQSPESDLDTAAYPSRLEAESVSASDEAPDARPGISSQSKSARRLSSPEIMADTPLPQALQAPVPDTASTAMSADSAMPQEEIALVGISPMAPAIRTLNRSMDTLSSPLAEHADPQSPEDGQTYRQSPATWLKQIRQLLDDKQKDEARTEYDLFRKAFPAFEPDFKPDF